MREDGREGLEKVEMGTVFVNEHYFLEKQNSMRTIVSFNKKTNDGRLTWMVQRNKKKLSFFLNTNKQLI